MDYQIFKVFGSLLILLVTHWLPFTVSLQGLGWFTVCICAVWILLVMILKEDYRLMVQKFVSSISN